VGIPTDEHGHHTDHPSYQPTWFPSMIPTSQPIIPLPYHDDHHDDHHHHSNDTNKFDMAIAGIIISAVIVIFGIFIYYRRKIHKERARMRREDFIRRYPSQHITVQNERRSEIIYTNMLFNH
jgi:hypothetical protein